LKKTAPIFEAFEKYVQTEIKSAIPQSSLGINNNGARHLLWDEKIGFSKLQIKVQNQVQHCIV
jgi:hypothetical protein